MFHTIARLRQKGEKMNRESNKCNGLEHVPPCSTWPPPWLAEAVETVPSTLAPSTPPRAFSAAELKEPPPADLSAGDWQEWVCRAIEADQGLPAGSLTLHPLPDVCPGCEFCQARGIVNAET